MSENDKDEDEGEDEEFHREGRIRETIDLIRLLFWFGRLVWMVFSSILSSGH